jgi:hypothetical protein
MMANNGNTELKMDPYAVIGFAGCLTMYDRSA